VREADSPTTLDEAVASTAYTVETVSVPAVPIAVVSQVLPDSVAERAGIKVNDQLVQIGSIFARGGRPVSVANLRRGLPQVLRAYQGKALPVHLLRDGTPLEVVLHLSATESSTGCVFSRIP